MADLLTNENLAEYEDQEDDVRTSNYAITSYGADYPVDGSHYLTKMKRLQESDPAAPVPLYSESDIARVCSER